jgi:hypothetical protein
MFFEPPNKPGTVSPACFANRFQATRSGGLVSGAGGKARVPSAEAREISRVREWMGSRVGSVQRVYRDGILEMHFRQQFQDTFLR